MLGVSTWNCGNDGSGVRAFSLLRSMPPGFSLIRASSGTYFNSTSVLATAGTDEARFDHNPVTLAARGLLLEGARTNGIRNSAMQGASAPSTLPTNWGGFIGGGLTRTVVGTGTANGLDYIDIRFNGTASSTTGCSINLEATTTITASNGQTWANSLWLSVVGGSTANLNVIRQLVAQVDAGGSILSTFNGSSILSALTASPTRFEQVVTTNNASIAFVRPSFEITFSNGAIIDITLRFASPQMELGAFASSYIPTTSAAATRAIDLPSAPLSTIGFNPNEGTIIVEFEAIGINSGATQRIFTLDDGTTNNVIALGIDSSGSRLLPRIANGGTTTYNATGGTLSAGTVFKAALAWKADDAAMALGGSIASSDSSTTIPTGLTTLRLNSGASGTSPGFVWIRSLTYYPYRLSNAQCQALTA